MIVEKNRFLGKIGESLNKTIDNKQIVNEIENLVLYNKNEILFEPKYIKDSNNINILKLVDKNNNEIETDDIYILLNGKQTNKVKPLNKTTIILEMKDILEIDMYGNKTMLGINYKINESFVVDQLLTNRNLTLYLTCIDNERLITFAKSKSYLMSELKESIGKTIKVGIKNKLQISGDLKLNGKAKELILVINYLPQSKFYECNTFDDVFTVLYEIYKDTEDINYIKQCLNYSRQFYDIMMEEINENIHSRNPI